MLGGARLLTGSYAPAYAGANGPIFSRGAMITAALAKATGARPIVVGKPSRAALLDDRATGSACRPAQLAVIGDDAHMDIALGRMGGSRTDPRPQRDQRPRSTWTIPERRRPDAVVDGVAELLDWL